MKKIKQYIKSVLKKLNILKEPSECSLFMTEVCNFKCKGCRRSVIEIHKAKELQLETVQALVSKYPQIKSFCIAGQGEPTLCSNFVEIVDFLKNKKKYTFIITNASNISKFIELNTRPDCISISLYGYDNQSYEDYCGVPVFDKVIDNFKSLKEKFPRVGFSYIVNKENYLDLAQVVKLCDEIQPDFLDVFNYLAYDPESDDEVNKIIKSDDFEIINYINSFFTAERKYMNARPSFLNLKDSHFKCNSYSTLINLDGEGNIGGCRVQIVPDAMYGNIHQDKDPFKSQEMRRLRDLSKNNCQPHNTCKYCIKRVV